MAISRGNSLLMKKQWAEDGSTVIPNPPVAGTTYRDESVDADNIAEGQQYDGVADSARWNQLLYIMTGILKDTLAHGVLPWLNTQDYAEGAIVIGTNGQLYRAKKATGPTTSNAKDPVTDTTEAVWLLYGTLRPQNVSTPLTFTLANGLSISLGDGVKNSDGKLTLIIANKKGLVLDSTGLQVNLDNSWVKIDESGRISGSFARFSDNIDTLHSNKDGYSVSYYVTSEATGTHPSEASSGNYQLIVLGNVQLALGGSQFLCSRKWIISTSQWSPWVNAIKDYMPVGAVYVQFANQPDPTSLFGGTWSNISNSYAGLFFRAEGGAAAAFGGSQSGGLPGITGSAALANSKVGVSARDTSGAFYATGNYSRGTAASSVLETQSNLGINAKNSSNLYGAATEVRPVNSTIRIWKRTA